MTAVPAKSVGYDRYGALGKCPRFNTRVNEAVCSEYRRLPLFPTSSRGFASLWHMPKLEALLKFKRTLRLKGEVRDAC